jgi:transposase
VLFAFIQSLNQREDVVAKRERWISSQVALLSDRLVFLDESSINTGMVRLYGRSVSGRRVIDYAPDARFERTTMLSSVRLNGDTVPMLFDGSLNGALFKTYIAQFLAPTLNRGDIVIMDNLSSHKVSGVAEAIAAVGAKVCYLPPYSPDFNPIELMWSKLTKTQSPKQRSTGSSVSKSLGQHHNN